MDKDAIIEALLQATLFGGFAPAVKKGKDKVGRIMRGPAEADAIAELEFPDDARDSSKKNAFRHALGTGMLAQELGGGYSGAAGAKAAGYIWELLGLPGGSDSLHDLNANAIGAAEAVNAPDRAALIAALLKHAAAARKEAPPSLTQRTPGYMTYEK